MSFAAVKRLPVRWRLTLWYTASLALILCTYAAGVLAWTRHERLEQLEQEKDEEFDPAEAARDRAALDEDMSELTQLFAFAIPAGVLLAGIGGWWLARRALRPVERITEQARSITADNLAARLPVANEHDELGRLAIVCNSMIERLERSFDQLRRFTADASHELRTPLTAVKSVGEVGLRTAREPAELRDVIGSMLEETDRLTRLVDGLLTLSRADAGHVKLERKPCDLAALARAVRDELAVLAEEKQQELVVDASEPVVAEVDVLLIRQVVQNLVDNAIKFSPRASPIRIVVSKAGAGADARAVVEVRDRGPGIAREHQAHLFDRFYRVDAGRSRASGGVGLGLAIARWAVELHGGRVELESEAGNGATFRVVLPAVIARSPSAG